MFKLRALERYGRQRRLRCLEDCQRLGYVEIGHRSPGAEVAGQLEGFAEDLDAGVEDSPLGIERSQSEIVHGHFGLNHQSDGFEVVGAGLGLRTRGFDAAANAAPEINLVAEAQRYQKIVERGAPDGTAG